MKKSPRHIKNILVYVIAAFTPWTGLGDIVVTNSTELLRYLGYGGRAGIKFNIDATVEKGSRYCP
jgi:hypothetical protein